MSVVAQDRWTCPQRGCGKTVVIDGSPEDVAAAIVAVQLRHGKAHEQARKLEARLRRLPLGRLVPAKVPLGRRAEAIARAAFDPRDIPDAEGA